MNKIRKTAASLREFCCFGRIEMRICTVSLSILSLGSVAAGIYSFSTIAKAQTTKKRKRDKTSVLPAFLSLLPNRVLYFTIYEYIRVYTINNLAAYRSLHCGTRLAFGGDDSVRSNKQLSPRYQLIYSQSKSRFLVNEWVTLFFIFFFILDKMRTKFM